MLPQFAERLAVFLGLLDQVAPPDQEFAYELDVCNGMRAFQVLGVGAHRFIVVLDTGLGSDDSAPVEAGEEVLLEALSTFHPHVSTIAVSVKARPDLLTKHVIPYVSLPRVFAPAETTVQVLSDDTVLCICAF